MLYLDIDRVMALRGIPNTQKFLMANGFSYNIAFRIVKENDTHLKFEHLEKICLLLHCTPNDLLVWKPADENSDANHPMQALAHNTTDILTRLKNAPLEKLNQFSQWLAQQDEKK